MRLIDADAACERCRMKNNGSCGVCIIGTAPTVDAVVLPCKIGGRVFCVLRYKNEIVEDVVEDYDIWSIKDGIKLRLSLLNHKSYVIGEFGKTVFLTREEAEAALAERTNTDA